MWYFVSPQVVFGEGALCALEEIQGRTALIVTDANLVSLGIAQQVKAPLEQAGLQVHIFDAVEADPCVETVQAGVQVARETEPDWIIGLGGGSPMDVAKAVWVLYERPDLRVEEINPMVQLGLRKKARLMTIPTTSGTGAEVTWGFVITDKREGRKMGLGNRENVADLAIVDPSLAMGMPPGLTADTGLDALVHAVEGYTCTWHNDLTDGMCIQAARLIFSYLARAVADGADIEARERMHNAAICAGLGFGNAMASVAHAMGHVLGAIFHLPHGRAVGISLPYTIEFAAPQAPERFAELYELVGESACAGEEGARRLAEKITALCREVGVPTSLSEAGVDREAFELNLDKLVEDAFNDTQMVTAVRCPTYDELRKLFIYAYEGKQVDF
jgi:alcohol dehydrogenase class IV